MDNWVDVRTGTENMQDELKATCSARKGESVQNTCKSTLIHICPSVKENPLKQLPMAKAGRI